MAVNEYAISLPFSIDDFGGFSSTTSQSKIWADRVRSAVGTLLAERVIRPTYGTEIPEGLFDSIESASGRIEPIVEDVFNTYLSPLELEEVQVTLDDLNGTFYIDVLYLLPNKEQTSVSIGLATISQDTPIIEELL
jgi:phage baseplate assembly protein W